MARHWMAALMVAALILTTHGVCSADKITGYIDRWEEVDLHGKISYLSTGKDYIIVSERRVFLVDLSHEGKRYMTAICDDSGRRLRFSDLRVGQWVSVWGGILKDKRIGARAVIAASSSYSDTKVKEETYQKLKNCQPWGQ